MNQNIGTNEVNLNALTQDFDDVHSIMFYNITEAIKLKKQLEKESNEILTSIMNTQFSKREKNAEMRKLSKLTSLLPVLNANLNSFISDYNESISDYRTYFNIASDMEKILVENSATLSEPSKKILIANKNNALADLEDNLSFIADSSDDLSDLIDQTNVDYDRVMMNGKQKERKSFGEDQLLITVKNKATNLGKSVMKATKFIGQNKTSSIEKTKKFFKNNSDKVLDYAQNRGIQIADAASAIKTKAVSVGHNIKDVAIDIGHITKNSAIIAGVVIKEKSIKLKNNAVKATTFIGQKTTSGVKKIGNFFNKNINKGMEFVKGVGLNIGQTAKNTTKRILNKTYQKASTVVNHVATVSNRAQVALAEKMATDPSIIDNLVQLETWRQEQISQVGDLML